MTRPSIPCRNAAATPRNPPPRPQEHKGNCKAFRAVLGAPAASPEPKHAQTAPDPAVGPSPLAPKRGPAEAPLEGPSEQAARAPTPPDPLDPMTRALAIPAGRTAEQVPPREAPPLLAAPDEVLLDRVVKRLSWGGSGKRGTARIELGAGSLAGATLLVHVEGSELTLEVEGAEAEAVRAFALRLAGRLGPKGIVLGDVRHD